MSPTPAGLTYAEMNEDERGQAALTNAELLRQNEELKAELAEIERIYAKIAADQAQYNSASCAAPSSAQQRRHYSRRRRTGVDLADRRLKAALPTIFEYDKEDEDDEDDVSTTASSNGSSSETDESNFED